MEIESNEKPIISKKDQRLALLVWFRLSRFYNQSIKQTNQHLQKYGITMSQFDALNKIGKYQPLTQQALGDKLEVTKGNITQLLRRMEKAGWIEREQEWKTKYISLTEAGTELYEKVVPRQENFQMEQFCGLDHEEQAQLLHLLKKLQKKSHSKEKN